MTARALIIGHGAIGSVFACALAEAGVQIHALASDATTDGCRQRRLLCGDEPPRAYSFQNVADLSNSAPYEFVVVSVKTTALSDVAESVISAAGTNGIVISAMNGIPWWFAEDDARQPLLQQVPQKNIVGCVINLAATRINETDVELRGGRELVFGDARHGRIARAEQFVKLLSTTWVKCRAVSDIRVDLWRKLLNNASVNPVSALCMATCGQVTGDAGTRSVIRKLMQEVADVGKAYGLPIDDDLEERINWSASYGAFKTSMLQDIENRRALEVDALLTSVIWLAERQGLQTPYLSCIASLIALRGALNIAPTSKTS